MDTVTFRNQTSFKRSTPMALHPSIAHLPLPLRMQKLKVDHRGFPVPYFVAWHDGQPDHRTADGRKLVECVRRKLCWLCGQKLGDAYVFVIGPMCAVNRVSSEPPSHRSCALYAVQACPFLARPHARRREAGMPEDAQLPAGEMITRNPGVTLVWCTRKYKVVGDGAGGQLFRLGDCQEALWFAEGRPATREEVLHSIETGLPLLKQRVQSFAELRLLEAMLAEALQLVPKPEQVLVTP